MDPRRPWLLRLPLTSLAVCFQRPRFGSRIQITLGVRAFVFEHHRRPLVRSHRSRCRDDRCRQAHQRLVVTCPIQLQLLSLKRVARLAQHGGPSRSCGEHSTTWPGRPLLQMPGPNARVISPCASARRKAGHLELHCSVSQDFTRDGSSWRIPCVTSQRRASGSRLASAMKPPPCRATVATSGVRPPSNTRIAETNRSESTPSCRSHPQGRLWRLCLGQAMPRRHPSLRRPHHTSRRGGASGRRYAQ
jgi:hypothetical protein